MRSNRYNNDGRDGREQFGGRHGGRGEGHRRHREGGRRGEGEGFGPGGFGPGFGPYGGPSGPGGAGRGPGGGRGRGFGPGGGGREFGPGGPGGRGRGFGPGGPGGFGGRGRGRRRRGDVRLALLLLLQLDGPLNGYQLIQGLQERSEGRWNPSPGSVYPALNQLEDEGLIKSAEVEGESGRAFELTDAGRAHVEELGEVKAPWESGGAHDDSVAELWHGFAGLGRAAKQIVADGDPAQMAKAAELFAQTRKQLYRILAGDEDQA